VLNAGILSLGVFPNQHGIHIVIWSFVSLDGYAGANIREEIESATKSQIERNMTLAD